MNTPPPWTGEVEKLWKRYSIRVTSSVLGDSCWVCGRDISFLSVERKRNDHHVIPVAYGGQDGPLVSLCSAHHSLLHEVGLAFISRKSSDASGAVQALNKVPEVPRLRVLWLASRVYLAHRVFNEDRRRLVKVTVSIPKGELELLDKAREQLSLSREEFIRSALQAYAKAQFPL